MAKGRMLDKVVILSKKLNQISEGAENLYYRILIATDDFGRFHAAPEIIKGQLYTIRKISLSIIKKRLDELWEVELIKLYEDDSEIYLEIIGFEKHQKFRSDIQRKADYPEPKNFLQMSRNEIDTSRNETERNGTKRCSKLIKDKLIKDKAEKTSLFEKKIEEEFEEFWKFYRSMGNSKDDVGDKQEAFGAYKILRKSVSKEEIAKATHGEADYLKYKRLEDNFEQRKKFTSTWLRDEKWKVHADFEYKPRL